MESVAFLLSISYKHFFVLFCFGFSLVSFCFVVFGSHYVGLLLFDDVVCDGVLFLDVVVFTVVLELSCLGCWIDVGLVGCEAKLLSYVWQAIDVTDLTLLA